MNKKDVKVKSMPESTWLRFRSQVVAHGMTVAQALCEAIELWIEKIKEAKDD